LRPKTGWLQFEQLVWTFLFDLNCPALEIENTKELEKNFVSSLSLISTNTTCAGFDGQLGQLKQHLKTFFQLITTRSSTFNSDSIWVRGEVLFKTGIKFIFPVLSKELLYAPVNKKNFSSLIITNMELRFELCVLNLIWKLGAKEPKKKRPFNFH
jgi:hypothetical protein